MTWYPLAYLPPQFENTSGVPYSGAVLKAYAAGTTDPIAMATGVDGATLTASFVMNAAGYPTYGGDVVIPHISEDYKLALYPTQAAADADSGAVWTVDDIGIAASTNTAFVEYFDGDGVLTTFTLSEDLGTDEKALMVFADRPLPNYVSNGTFDTDTIWTKGAGWTIGASVATATGAISTDLSQNAVTPLVQGMSYTIEYTITRSAGGVIPKIGGTSGTERTSSGTYKETIIAGSTQALTFSGNAFTGTVDTVTVKPTYAALRQIIRPDEYTLVGNQLTLSFIPPSGTKNVIVFAPSLLLGAANDAAAAAATSETNAAASASAAATSALQAAANVKWKPVVACATTANITLSGEQTIDTVLTSTSRVLVKNQTLPAENGVYVSAAGAWARATDADTWDELASQAVTVNGGSANIQKSFINTNESGGTLGTDAVTWTQFYVYPVAAGLTAATPVTSDYVIISDVSDSGNSKKALVSDLLALTSSSGGFKNFITNGAFNIWQRATTYALTTSAAYGAADRWAAIMGSSAAGIFNRDTNAPVGFFYNAKVGRNNGSSLTNQPSIMQVLETINSVALAGQTVTLSYYAKKGANFSAASSIMAVAAFSGSGLDQSPANMIAGSWTSQATPLSTSDTLTTSWQRFQHTFTIVSTATQVGVIFSFLPVGTAGADDNFYIAGIQLEIGSAAGAFENRPFATELALCQRYYEKSFTYSVAPVQNSGDNNGQLEGIAGKAGAAAEFLPMRFTTRKRVAPTVTLYNPAAANAQARDLSAAADCSATSAAQISESAFRVSATGNASTAVGNILGVHWQADAEI
jgi:hypothetical protein